MSTASHVESGTGALSPESQCVPAGGLREYMIGFQKHYRQQPMFTRFTETVSTESHVCLLVEISARFTWTQSTVSRVSLVRKIFAMLQWHCVWHHTSVYGER